MCASNLDSRIDSVSQTELETSFMTFLPKPSLLSDFFPNLIYDINVIWGRRYPRNPKNGMAFIWNRKRLRAERGHENEKKPSFSLVSDLDKMDLKSDEALNKEEPGSQRTILRHSVALDFL